MAKKKNLRIRNSTAEFLIFSRQARENSIEVRVEEDNRLRAYQRRNDNRVSIDFLDSLAIQSVHLVKQLEPHKAPEPAIWFGYYGGE